MPSPIFKSLTIGAFLFASPASATIPNWDINFLQLITDFSNGSTDEITLKYEIGMGRTYQVDLFDKGCTAPITTTINTTHSTTSKDTNHDYLDVLLNMDKSTIASSNIWNPFSTKIEMCVRLQLLSGSNVIKEDVRDIDIAFDYQIDFSSNEGSLQEAALSSGSSTTTVDNYVQSCTCDDASSFTCNTDALGPNSLLNICVKSLSSDMEIDFLNDLKMTQGSEELIIVETNQLQDSAISSMTLVPAKNGVHVASVIPSKFFSYSGTSNAVVTGMVYLKLAGSRRRLAVEITGYPKVHAVSYHRIMGSEDDGEDMKFDRPSFGENDHESPFVVNVQLKRESEVATDSSSGSIVNRYFGFAAVFILGLLHMMF
jgi:hypothetical protein